MVSLQQLAPFRPGATIHRTQFSTSGDSCRWRTRLSATAAGRKTGATTIVLQSTPNVQLLAFVETHNVLPGCSIAAAPMFVRLVLGAQRFQMGARTNRDSSRPEYSGLQINDTRRSGRTVYIDSSNLRSSASKTSASSLFLPPFQLRLGGAPHFAGETRTHCFLAPKRGVNPMVFG